MDANEQEAREQRGLEIAARAKLERSGDRWFVPSQSKRTGMSQGGSYYVVKPDQAKPHCTCPDFEARHLRCKDSYAVEIVTRREYSDDGLLITRPR